MGFIWALSTHTHITIDDLVIKGAVIRQPRGFLICYDLRIDEKSLEPIRELHLWTLPYYKDIIAKIIKIHIILVTFQGIAQSRQMPSGYYIHIWIYGCRQKLTRVCRQNLTRGEGGGGWGRIWILVDAIWECLIYKDVMLRDI